MSLKNLSETLTITHSCDPGDPGQDQRAMMKLFWKISFLSYFFLYAVSPLTVTIARPAGSECLSLQGAGQGPHALLPEMIAEKMLASHDDARKPESESIIIKKKRAVVPEDYAGQFASFDAVSTQADPDGPLRTGVERHYALSPQLERIPNGFYRLYAGHSPPLA